MYKLTLTPQQLAIINSALQELPFKIVAPLFEELNKQIQETLEERTETIIKEPVA